MSRTLTDVARLPAQRPSPECESEGLAWYERLREKRPYGHGYTATEVQRIAMRHPEAFPEAARCMREQSRPWVGVRTDVLGWLERECVIVQAERVDARARAEAKARARGAGRQYVPPPRTEPEASSPSQHYLGPVRPSAEWEAEWESLKRALQGRVEAWDFAHWIKPMTAAGLAEDGAPVLGCPDSSHCEWVDEAFGDAFRELCGERVPRLTTWDDLRWHA